MEASSYSSSSSSSLSSTKRQKSSPASASGGSIRWKYDVFLSFRGEDTRYNFTNHLYAALHRNGIITFKDDERLERGTEISSELTKAIQESRFSIVIFSKDYASSAWCLEELAKIVECVDTKNHIVIPVFYDVEASHVRKQKGEFKKAFDQHQQNHDNEKVQRWRAALKRVANTVGDPIRGRSMFMRYLECWNGLSHACLPLVLIACGFDILGRLEAQDDFYGLGSLFLNQEVFCLVFPNVLSRSRGRLQAEGFE
ncbi:hypothetical protein LWI29_017572 [Acer saccharum]|uniref:ADP-ribosyl cyclase/cyclic ADP-ribose hydrolase n=1 Tax=Acer saccharum TaxID=4024 RepID=A0AA39STD0_ACESA|nr:hypothetical protein LWI29_017572 [Acer saccharum]